MTRKPPGRKVAGRASSRARARRGKGAGTRSRFAPKPKGRKAQMQWAETLGMAELGWIHGGQESCNPCCGWTNCSHCPPGSKRCAPPPRGGR